jgi:hypothetical protein
MYNLLITLHIKKYCHNGPAYFGPKRFKLISVEVVGGGMSVCSLMQGKLTDGEGSVQYTSLRLLVL